MILIDKYKCGYSPVPKSGSTSVCSYFAELLGVQKIKPYLSEAQTFRNEWSSTHGIIPKDYYVFCFVRNPWTRFVSAYYEFVRYHHDTAGGERGAVRQNKKWSEQGRLTIPEMMRFMPSKDAPPPFDDFVNFVVNIEQQHGKPNNHWASQCSKLRAFTLKDKKRIMRISDYDFIGRLETLGKDLKHVASVIGSPIDKAPWRHKLLAKSGKTCKDFYTNQKLIDDVGKYYEEDIDKFKYTFYALS